MLSGKAHFEGARYISMSPDGSKIGDKGLVISPMVESVAGIAMWAAPQVATGRPGYTLVARETHSSSLCLDEGAALRRQRPSDKGPNRPSIKRRFGFSEAAFLLQ